MENGRFQNSFLLGDWRRIYEQVQSGCHTLAEYTMDELDVIIPSMVLGDGPVDVYIEEYDRRATAVNWSITSLTNNTALCNWHISSRPVPPPAIVKHIIISSVALLCSSHILVETGTYTGMTTHSMSTLFERLLTLEASKDLFVLAKRRFARKAHITCIHEKSLAKVHNNILNEMSVLYPEDPSKARLLFWLDAHYSGGITSMEGGLCPLLQEVLYITEVHPTSALIIDDLRLILSKEAGYPSIDDLTCLLKKTHRLSKVSDTIIAIPNDLISE
jgi:hypothetical protein